MSVNKIVVLTFLKSIVVRVDHMTRLGPIRFRSEVLGTTSSEERKNLEEALLTKRKKKAKIRHFTNLCHSGTILC